MVKEWNSKELFNYFKEEAKLEDFRELYKAMLAREIGLDEYTKEADNLMDEVLDNDYYDDASIPSFIDYNLVGKAHEVFKEANFEVDDWGY